MKKLLKNILDVYHHRKPFFYYRILGFSSMVSITVLSIVFGINADIVKQYENFRWYNPISILHFVEDQLDFEITPVPTSIENKSPSPDSLLEKHRFLFFVDRTPSTRLPEDFETYKSFITESIMEDFLKKTITDEKDRERTRNLSLQEILCMKMLFSFFPKGFDTNKESCKLEVGIAFIDGYNINKRGDQFTFPNMDPNGPKSPIYEISFKNETEYSYYSKVFRAFVPILDNSEKDSGDELIPRTDFKAILNEIQRKYFDLNEKNGKKSTIITLFSDFHHDVKFRTEQLSTFEEVNVQIKNLFNGTNIHQINLVSIPVNPLDLKKEDSNLNQVQNEIKQLVRIFKLNFSNAYYYQMDAATLAVVPLNRSDQERTVNDRIDKIIAPTIKSETPITFYYPYYDAKLGNSREAKSNLKFNVPSNNYVLSLHSNEVYNEMDNLKFSLKFDNNDKNIYSNNLQLNSSLTLDIDKGDIINALYYNYSFAEQFSDLTLDIFKSGSNCKVKFPIVFKEKLSKLNAIIIAMSLIGLFIFFVQYFVFMITDWMVSEERKVIYIYFFLMVPFILLFILGLKFLHSLDFLNFIPLIITISLPILFYMLYWSEFEFKKSLDELSGREKLNSLYEEIPKIKDSEKLTREAIIKQSKDIIKLIEHISCVDEKVNSIDPIIRSINKLIENLPTNDNLNETQNTLLEKLNSVSQTRDVQNLLIEIKAYLDGYLKDKSV